VFHSLEEWARTGPSRCLQAASRRPRLTSLAMMARRVVARRRVVKKWWAPSTYAAHARGNPARRTLAGAAWALTRKEEPARSRNVATRKGRQCAARHAPDADVDRRGSPGG